MSENTKWKPIETIPDGQLVFLWEPMYGQLLGGMNFGSLQIKSTGNFWHDVPAEVDVTHWKEIDADSPHNKRDKSSSPTPHSAGPWEWDVVGSLIGKDGKTVIENFGYDGLGFNSGSEDEDEANRRVIAASPNLLEALQTIVAGYESGRSGSFSRDIAHAAISALEEKKA